MLTLINDKTSTNVKLKFNAGRGLISLPAVLSFFVFLIDFEVIVRALFTQRLCEISFKTLLSVVVKLKCFWSILWSYS